MKPPKLDTSKTFYLSRTELGRTSSTLFDDIITQVVATPRALILTIKHSVEFRAKYFGRSKSVVRYLYRLLDLC